MKRRFTLLTAALMLLAFLTQPLGVRGQTRVEEVAYTLDGTLTGGSNGYATESEITQNNITWMVTGNTEMSPWRIGGKNISGVDRPVYSTTAMSDNITKIVVTHGTAANITVNSMTLLVSSNANFSNPTSTIAGTFTASATTTFDRPTGADWSNKYFKIVYNVTVSGNSNRFLQFIKAEFYKESGGTSQTVATPTFTPAAGTYGEAQTVTISCTTEGATIHYTIDGTTPTPNSAVYSNALTISETTTVKAYAVKEEMNDSPVASATYTIQQMTTINSIADLWNFVAQVGTTATPVNVTFNNWYVSGMKGNQVFVTDGQYGFVIYQSGHGFSAGDKLNGTVTCNALMYQNHYAELTGVTANALTVTSGQEVPLLSTTIGALELRNYGTAIDLGTLVYNGTAFVDETGITIPPYNNFNLSPNPIESLELDKQYHVKGVSIIYWPNNGSQTQQVAPRSADDFEEVTAPTLSVATPTFSPEEGTYTEQQNVSILCETEGADIYYTTDGTTPAYSMAGVQGTLYDNPISITETTTVKAIAVKTGMNNSEVATAVYTIEAPAPSLTFHRLSNHTDVTEDGTYLIVNVTDSVALTSANGSGSAPDAVPVTIIGDSICGNIAAALQWNFTAVENGYKINPIGDSGYLYSTNTNNGVRVGTGDNNVWEIDVTDTVITTYHGFKNVALNRYLGVYSKSNWRTYTSINNNIKNTQIEIFVLGDAPFSPTYYTINIAEGITNGTVTTNPAQQAAEGTTITVTASPDNNYELASLTYSYAGVNAPIDIMDSKQFSMPAADVTINATFVQQQTGPTLITIAEARALANDEYALVQGVVTFKDGRNIYVQDETAGIDLYLNNNTVPQSLAVGDMVQAYGKRAVYKGLVELSGINGGDEEQFSILSSGNQLPLAVKTIAEILADYQGSNMLQSTRVMIEDAIIGEINTANNTPISQGENTLNIYKMPVVEGLLEGDSVIVTGIIGCFNAPQLRVNSADDVQFTHPTPPGPSLVANPDALDGFTYAEGNGPSAIQSFTLTGSNLTSTAYVYPSENYQISTFGGDRFAPERRISINAPSGNFSYNIFVRLKADLEVGSYEESLTYCCADLDTMYLAVSGMVTEPAQSSDYVRISDLSQIGNGAKVIFAARFNESAGDYYAMTAQASGKPEGVLFTSVANGDETLPNTIADEESTYYWTVTTDGTNYTFTNAGGDVLGYTSSTNFATGGDNVNWTIAPGTSEATAMVPEYSAFVITNSNVTNRAFALNSNHNYGPYHTQNLASETYNFFIDIFATAGGTPTCATPTFNPEGGTYYEAQTVTISCGTADATIYYTLDGTDPTPNSTEYTEPIEVAENMTIKAFAVKEGFNDSNIAEAEYTIIIGAATVFNQDWEGEMNGWTFVTVEGNKPWTIGQYQGNHYANANGFNGGANEQWCISPAFNLDNYDNETLTFMNAMKFTGPDMEVFFSNDYDGQDPTNATWVPLTYTPSPGNYEWIASGPISLADFDGDNCYIGFKYTSTENEAASWEIDDIMLIGFTSDPYLTVTPASLTGFTHVVGEGPSASQTFVVSGGNLPPAPGGEVGGVTITCDNTYYELSLDDVDYYPYLGIAVVGTLEPTTVYVRLNGEEVGPYEGTITLEDYTTATVTLSGTVMEPVQGGDWIRIGSLDDLHDGDQLVIAARYDATVGDGYYAMTAGVSGKPDGVLFTSVNEDGIEMLPDEMVIDIATYVWNVTVNDTVITLTNAAGDMLGYSSSTNFAGNTSTDWSISYGISGENAMVPNYSGFLITNVETNNRCIVMNASHKFGAYHTNNINNADYNFYLDLFVQGGEATQTVATPVFSVASGTYYEEFDVEITCTTEGATIYYTTDGSDPTAESTVYDDPIHVDADMTIKAIAMMEGYEDSNIATANYVVATGLTIIFNQDWEGEMNGWTFVTIEGNKPWAIGTYAGNKYAYANGYNDDADNEQWCISPAFNLTQYARDCEVNLSFMNATKFEGPALELYFSNDYDGRDPSAATWQPLSYTPSPGNYEWTESGEISLNGFTGENCYIGFRYISTLADGAAAWEVDDILLAVRGYNAVEDELSNVDIWNRSHEIMIENGGNAMKMVVYNILGQPVMSANVASGSNCITHHLCNGLYIVTLQNNEGRMATKIVVR